LVLITGGRRFVGRLRSGIVGLELLRNPLLGTSRGGLLVITENYPSTNVVWSRRFCRDQQVRAPGNPSVNAAGGGRCRGRCSRTQIRLRLPQRGATGPGRECDAFQP